MRGKQRAPGAMFLPAVLATVLGSAVLAAATQAATMSRGGGTQASSSAAKGAQTFRVTITFAQERPWTDYYQQASTDPPPCSRTTEGHGDDSVRTSAIASFTYQPSTKSRTGLGVTVVHSRTGASTLTVAGAECAPSAVFPSTWSIITQTAGTVSATAPHTGCGTKQVRTSPSLELVGSKLWLRWSSQSLPDFGDCPYFEGSDHLPTGWYRDVSAPVSLAALRNASLRRISTSGTAKQLTATETCANIPSHCGEGITYNATASVSTSVAFVLVRVRP
jgi:hypothetical protein